MCGVYASAVSYDRWGNAPETAEEQGRRDSGTRIMSGTWNMRGDGITAVFRNKHITLGQ